MISDLSQDPESVRKVHSNKEISWQKT